MVRLKGILPPFGTPSNMPARAEPVAPVTPVGTALALFGLKRVKSFVKLKMPLGPFPVLPEPPHGIAITFIYWPPSRKLWLPNCCEIVGETSKLQLKDG